MSLSAYALAVRNHLRANLTNFYENVSSSVATRDKENHCRITQDDLPSAMAGKEFIAIYGTSWKPGDTRITRAIEEISGLTIGVTHRVSDVPRDHRAEVSYLYDSDKFTVARMSLEQRCREIIKLLDKNYTVMQAANALFDNYEGFSEPLLWLGCDAQPKIVGAEHFIAQHKKNDHFDDEQYGLLMHVQFGEALRLQGTANFDAQV